MTNGPDHRTFLREQVIFKEVGRAEFFSFQYFSGIVMFLHLSRNLSLCSFFNAIVIQCCVLDFVDNLRENSVNIFIIAVYYVCL